MKTLPLVLLGAAIAVVISVFFLYTFSLSESKNNIEIINFQVQPSTIKVGDTFAINATLVNNSQNPIYVDVSPCAGPFSVIFDSHVTADVKQILCEDVLIRDKVNPGENMTVTGPGTNLAYRAVTAGTTNATVTFSYFEQNQADPNSSNIMKTISKSFLFTITKAENQENNGIVVTLSEGQREGPILVQKIFADSIQGLDFREYPLATNVGYPITLHIGDSASNGCTVELTLVKINDNAATFLKKEYQNRPCPICLSENTVIDTPNGPVNVKELKIGMTVLTQDSSGHKQTSIILKTGRTLVPPDHRMIHIILADKRELYVSPNHPTSDGRLFGDLLLGDTLDGSKIKSTEQVPYNGTYTYDILPSGQTGFYWANGVLIESTLK